LALADISPSLAHVAVETGSLAAITVDLADPTEAQAAVDRAVGALDGLDCLVNVAGIQRVGLVTEMALEDWGRMMDVNLRAPFLTCRAAIPHLRASRCASIINMASVAGLRGGPGGTAYAASKGGLIAFSTALALELAPDRITVNSVCPGWVDTGFNAPIIQHLGGTEAHAAIVAAGVPLGRQGQPDDIAPTVLFLASPGARYITAQALIIDGGVYN
jgi:dihydroanticapsin dehydrogenase